MALFAPMSSNKAHDAGDSACSAADPHEQLPAAFSFRQRFIDGVSRFAHFGHLVCNFIQVVLNMLNFSAVRSDFADQVFVAHLQFHRFSEAALRVGRPFSSFIGPGIPDIRAQNDR